MMGNPRMERSRRAKAPVGHYSAPTGSGAPSQMLQAAPLPASPPVDSGREGTPDGSTPADSSRRAGRLRQGPRLAVERGLPRDDPDLRRPLRPPPLDDGRDLGRARRASPTARWGTPRSGTRSSAPGGSSTRTSSGSRSRSATATSSRTRPSSPPASAARAGRARFTSSGSSRTAASTRSRSTSTPSSSWPTGESVPRVVVHAFLDGRDTPPTSGLGNVGELLTRSRGRPERGASARSSGATTPWTATSAGTASRRAYRLLTEGEADRIVADADAGGRRRRTPTRARSPTSSWSRSRCARRRRRRPRRERRRRRHLLQLPRRPDARAHAGLLRGRASPASRAASARRSRFTHDDRVPGGLPPPGRLPAAVARQLPPAGPRRARARRTCGSPRRRSTPT